MTQRGDGIRTHGTLLPWMRLTTPRSSRQDAPPAIDDLYPGRRVRSLTSAAYRAAIECFGTSLTLCSARRKSATEARAVNLCPEPVPQRQTGQSLTSDASRNANHA